MREAADVLVEAAGLQRVDIEVKVPENGLAWARAGLPSLLADLKDYWPDCKDDLTFEIHFAMEASPPYRAWHGAEVETFRVEMNEAMADLFEQVDIVLCATSPMEPFEAEGPMPYNVGEVSVSPYNAGALTIPANLSGYPAISIPAGLTQQRPADRPAGVRPAPRRRAAARPGAGHGARAAVAAGRARRAHLAGFRLAAAQSPLDPNGPRGLNARIGYGVRIIGRCHDTSKGDSAGRQ